MIEVIFHFFLVLISFFFGGTPNPERDAKSYQPTCQDISNAISSNSEVYYPGSRGHVDGTFHWSVTSSQPSACTVEPGSAEDVGKILQILGKSRVPFGIKSGGHTMAPGFSSTPGVQIALTRFNKVNYDSSTETVEFGSGLRFDDVYNALGPHNRSVAGARVSGIGVGGFLLGGGYSWHTNQKGVALDTIVAFELVRPDGEVVKVTEHSDSELFFGLKGGLNNFGVVTRFTLNALPQPAVWAASITYPESAMSDVSAAIIKFSSNNKDDKANMTPMYLSINGTIMLVQSLYYDGPSPPSGLFDDFLTIPSLASKIHEGSFADFITSASFDNFAGLRSVLHTVPLLEHSPKIIAAIQNETTFWGATLSSKAGSVIYTVEPFLPSILSHNTAPTAYPPTRDHVYFPLALYAMWVDAAYDNEFYNVIRQSAARIRAVAIEDGQDITDAPLYPNYAMFDTPLSDMYGGNVDKLRSLRQRVDPDNVMGLAGGFKF